MNSVKQWDWFTASGICSSRLLTPTQRAISYRLIMTTTLRRLCTRRGRCSDLSYNVKVCYLTTLSVCLFVTNIHSFKLFLLPSGFPRERIRAMWDDPDRKSDMVPCRKGGVDLLHRNGRTPTQRLPGKQLGGIHLPKSLPCLWHGCGNAPRWGMPRKKKKLFL